MITPASYLSQPPYFPPITSDVIVDISHYENISPTFNNTFQSGIRAVILKATQGATFVDPTFLQRAKEARAAGLLVGAYHFLDAASSSDQIALFLQLALHEAQINWLALDWEPNPTSQASLAIATQAATIIQSATSKWPILYTIRYMLSAPNRTLSNCPLWLAEYGTRPICPPGFPRWKLWQHTDGRVGSNPIPVPGIGPCDRSKFAGTSDELAAWWSNPI